MKGAHEWRLVRLRTMAVCLIVAGLVGLPYQSIFAKPGGDDFEFGMTLERMAVEGGDSHYSELAERIFRDMVKPQRSQRDRALGEYGLAAVRARKAMVLLRREGGIADAADVNLGGLLSPIERFISLFPYDPVSSDAELLLARLNLAFAEFVWHEQKLPREPGMEVESLDAVTRELAVQAGKRAQYWFELAAGRTPAQDVGASLAQIHLPFAMLYRSLLLGQDGEPSDLRRVISEVGDLLKSEDMQFLRPQIILCSVLALKGLGTWATTSGEKKTFYLEALERARSLLRLRTLPPGVDLTLLRVYLAVGEMCEDSGGAALAPVREQAIELLSNMETVHGPALKVAPRTCTRVLWAWARAESGRGRRLVAREIAKRALQYAKMTKSPTLVAAAKHTLDSLRN